MKKRSWLLLVFICLFSLALPVLAHSGRTDASGGHRDNNNVSGLGSYHYHHGYPAHLHPNGICPYESASNSIPAPIPILGSDRVDTAFEKSSSPLVIPSGSDKVDMTYDELTKFGENLYRQGYNKGSSVARNESDSKIADLNSQIDELNSQVNALNKDIDNLSIKIEERELSITWLVILICVYAGVRIITYIIKKIKRK